MELSICARKWMKSRKMTRREFFFLPKDKNRLHKETVILSLTYRNRRELKPWSTDEFEGLE